MSEYITVEVESEDEPGSRKLVTNLNLVPNGVEVYHSPQEGAEGSPLAQALFSVEGLTGLTIEGKCLIVGRDSNSDIEWPLLIDDVTAVLKDFFL